MHGGSEEARSEFEDGGVDGFVFILNCWWGNESKKLTRCQVNYSGVFGIQGQQRFLVGLNKCLKRGAKGNDSFTTFRLDGKPRDSMFAKFMEMLGYVVIRRAFDRFSFPGRDA